MDISGFDRPYLTFDAYINLPPENDDFLSVLASSDNGSTFWWLAGIGGPYGIPDLNFNLTSYKSQTFKWMFIARSFAGPHTEGVYLDNITIGDFVPPQPPTASFTHSPTFPLISSMRSFLGRR